MIYCFHNNLKSFSLQNLAGLKYWIKIHITMRSKFEHIILYNGKYTFLHLHKQIFILEKQKIINMNDKMLYRFLVFGAREFESYINSMIK